jgi:hypothetical protein
MRWENEEDNGMPIGGTDAGCSDRLIWYPNGRIWCMVRLVGEHMDILIFGLVGEHMDLPPQG